MAELEYYKGDEYKGKIKLITNKGYGFIKVEGKKDVKFNSGNLNFKPEKEQAVSFIIDSIDGQIPIAIKVKLLADMAPVAKNVKTHQAQLQYILAPKDTVDEISNLTQIENFALRYQKFVIAKRNFEIDKKSAVFNFDFNKQKPRNYADNITESAKAIFGDCNFEQLELEVDWRLAIGLGTESVYETSLTLHHIYGIPYIPAQSLKGAVRNYTINKYFESEVDAIINNKTFCLLFGTPEEIKVKIDNKITKSFKSAIKKDFAGFVTFFEAFPLYLDGKTIKEDIMNPHYGDYYAKNKAPGDYYNPNPINFLTVENTPFRFVFGVNPKNNVKVTWFNEEMLLIDLAKKLIKEALILSGVGAKTAVGYGYFKEN